MFALHIIDPSTPEDAAEMLGLLVTQSSGVEHRVCVMGPRYVSEMAMRAGVPQEIIHERRTVGWADPTGWRGVGKLIRRFSPTHIHTWGERGLVAATVSMQFKGARIHTQAAPLTARQRKLMRLTSRYQPWLITAGSSHLHRQLLSAGTYPPRTLRVRPGIALGKAKGALPLELRRSLGIGADEGPVILLAGDSVAACHRDGLWAAAILQQMFTRTRVIVRMNERSENIHNFATVLPTPEMVAEAPAEIPWSTLVQAADIMLATPRNDMPIGPLLWAMAAGIPIVGTAVESISEMVEHHYTGMLTAPGKPRAIAARLEEFMSDSTLRWPLTDKARAQIFGSFRPMQMLENFKSIYGQTLEDPKLREQIVLPEEIIVNT